MSASDGMVMRPENARAITALCAWATKNNAAIFGIPTKANVGFGMMKMCWYSCAARGLWQEQIRRIPILRKERKAVEIAGAYDDHVDARDDATVNEADGSSFGDELRNFCYGLVEFRTADGLLSSLRHRDSGRVPEPTLWRRPIRRRCCL